MNRYREIERERPDRQNRVGRTSAAILFVQSHGDFAVNIVW